MDLNLDKETNDIGIKSLMYFGHIVMEHPSVALSADCLYQQIKGRPDGQAMLTRTIRQAIDALSAIEDTVKQQIEEENR